ncbi:MAG: DNA repair protein RecO [Planctomycetes bacterium GWF2_50_10]|nr:MAG: DNA repair protein RecO [Planctomycetes bacterium GWF2_50_10]
MLKKGQAICIRSLDYSDTSQILTFFSREHGKFDAIAKGSKRAKSAFGGPIEIFACGEVVFTEAGHGKLSGISEFANAPRFFSLRRNLESLNAALFGAELMELLMQDFDPHEELYDFFLQYLERLTETNDTIGSLALLIGFQVEVLKQVGHGPVLEQCVNCKTKITARWPVVYFSNSGPGVICRDCEMAFADKMNIDREAAMALAGQKSLAQLPLDVLQQVERILIGYLTDLLNKPPKMARVFLPKS